MNSKIIITFFIKEEKQKLLYIKTKRVILKVKIEFWLTLSDNLQ